MKRFLIEFEEICRGLVVVLAENEEDARNKAECEGTRLVNESHMTLGEKVQSVD